MSYGSHYGGGSNDRTNPVNSRDRDRENNRPGRSDWPERDRTERNEGNDRNDRGFNNRHHNLQKRYGSQLSTYGDLTSGSTYRRPEGGRDFYGYRSGYNRTDVAERNQGNSNNGSSNSRRRDRNSQYDLYQGSRYRPGSSKPKGPGQSQESVRSTGVSSSRNEPRREGRFDEASSKDLLDDRRLQNRKQDWDSSMSQRSKQLQPRLPNSSRDHQKAGSKSHGPAKVRVALDSGADHREPINFLSNVEGDEVISTRHELKKANTHTEKPLLKLQSSPRALVSVTNQVSVGGIPEAAFPDQVDANTPHTLHESLSFLDIPFTSAPQDTADHLRRSEDLVSIASDAVHKKDSLLRMFDDDDDDTPGVNKASNMGLAETKGENLDRYREDGVPGSPSSNGFDTSVLSPVGSTASDDAFVQTLNIIPETKSANRNNIVDEPLDLSETETVIDGKLPDMSASRLFLRKKGRDTLRGRAKRRNVIYSEDEEIMSEGEGDPPQDLESLAQRDKSHFSSDPIETNSFPEGPSPQENQIRPSNHRHDESSSITQKEHSPTHKSNHKSAYKIKRDSTGRSQLQRACKKGDLREVKVLISKGASANESDFGGFTCLHEASLAGHTDIVEYLIANGADVNKQALEAGDFETPLMDAAENKHISTVKTLLKNGADPHICNNDGYSTITKLFRLQEDDDEYEDVIKVINDFSPPKTNSELSKVTHAPREIIDDPSESYFSDLVRKNSQSLVYKYAAQGNKESAAEDFVTRGLSLLRMPDVLNLAARNGHVELVDILLGLNPGSFDINQLNNIGVNALLATVGRGFYDVVKFLLTKGADPQIKRAKDGLSALEIAKHSVQYDPREVVILEDFMNSHGKRTQPMEEILEPPMQKMNSHEPKRNMSFDDLNPNKRTKKASSELALSEEVCGVKTDHSSNEFVTKANEDEELDISFDSRARSSLPMENVKQTISSSVSHSPKFQEEQRLRAAEQAKIWQQKVQAKKRARKEMFLLAEKEKEKRRREEEEKRLELLKKQEIEQREQRKLELIEAKKIAEALEKKKQIMEYHYMLRKYPIGLQEAVFDGNFDKKSRLKYTPLYVFSVENDSWVIDMQVALILAVSVRQVHTLLKGNIGPEIDASSKDKLWSIFFRMIGVGNNNVIEENGMEKFRCLQLRFVRLADVADWMKLQHSEAYNMLWVENRITNVDLSSLEPAQTRDPRRYSNRRSHGADVGFVPPRFAQRGDVLKTIQTANAPLW
ncbi:hypothetical protein METBIDRAFT_79815 [Metschnikowia bicuspidata var. bicuspidata NRRL YB-4993]|uniref:Uncharacterized protein n=1 Tax=Metschnikowia bicuspidata var. bicuspidata NRRL YB-4993 TaxID=869754 RepID=A0A1A0H5Q3_9ASCO|nr:hypothetical protein METBIDRAFT_79815 [Metschnikowia bicuspidata var. bicuspidata NRRL YB-4993]OBA19285.1 hypothetical protein METBIDRAFT_79815 [Metschnikowia bicuspidata var. bicuspidata NRRL YB-4993]